MRVDPPGPSTKKSIMWCWCSRSPWLRSRCPVTTKPRRPLSTPVRRWPSMLFCRLGSSGRSSPSMAASGVESAASCCSGKGACTLSSERRVTGSLPRRNRAYFSPSVSAPPGSQSLCAGGSVEARSASMDESALNTANQSRPRRSPPAATSLSLTMSSVWPRMSIKRPVPEDSACGSRSSARSGGSMLRFRTEIANVPMGRLLRVTRTIFGGRRPPPSSPDVEPSPSLRMARSAPDQYLHAPCSGVPRSMASPLTRKEMFIGAGPPGTSGVILGQRWRRSASRAACAKRASTSAGSRASACASASSLPPSLPPALAERCSTGGSRMRIEVPVCSPSNRAVKIALPSASASSPLSGSVRPSELRFPHQCRPVYSAPSKWNSGPIADAISRCSSPSGVRHRVQYTTVPQLL